jgi:subtilisin family serine protease
MVGGAYDASFVLCKTEDVVTETPVEEDNYVAGIEFCELHGADLTTSSLGYIDWYTQADLDGRTAVTTIAVNIAAGNGVHCITAAGNSGHDANPATSTLGAPADGLYVISCGAVDDSGQIAGFSSSGPTADGRLKPELLAHGVNTAVTSSRNTTGYGTVSGTSLSTPIVASAVACLTQAHPGWTVAQMRAALMNTASDYAATGLTDPLFIRGYGIVNAFAALTALCDADITGDGGVDGDDVIAFFESWDAGHADFDASGGTDGDDVIAFFARWDAGC